MVTNKEMIREPIEAGRLSEEEIKKIDSEYCSLIDEYHTLWLKEKRQIGRPDFGSLSAEESWAITKPRDDLHKKLLELGAKLGYTKDVVQMDILTREGNLGEYGMPEFGIINHDDRTVFTGIKLYKDPRCDTFISEDFCSRRGYEDCAVIFDSPYSEKDDGYIEVVDKTERSKIVDAFYSRIFTEIRDGLVWRDGLRAGEGAIIFTLSYLNLKRAGFFMQPFIPDDFFEKQRRAMALANEMGFDIFSNSAYAPHASLNYVGVIVPSSRLEEVATKIYQDREKYGVRTEDIRNDQIERDRLTREGKQWDAIREMAIHHCIYDIDVEFNVINRDLTEEEHNEWLSRRERVKEHFKRMPIEELKKYFSEVFDDYEEERRKFFGYKEGGGK